ANPRPSRTPPRRVARRSSRARRPQRRRPVETGAYTRAASQRLSRFRQASRLAVALTGLLLLLWATVDPGAAVAEPPGETMALVATRDGPAGDMPDPAEAVEEARSAIEDLAWSFVVILPKLLIALSVMVVAFALSRLIRKLLSHYASS